MKPKIVRYILVTLLAFLGVSALSGGALLVISPSGELLGNLPMYLLKNSPFANFLIPGIILFFVLGVAPCLISIALIKKPKNEFAQKFNLFKDFYWAWSFTIYVAFALMIWIQVEMIIIYSIHWSYSFYMSLGIIILLVSLLPQVRKKYKRNKS